MRTFPMRLMQGYHTFRGQAAETGTYQHARLADEGQHPDTLVIACCDSRVTPELIFAADPGSLFVVRNVANLVPPQTSDGRNLSTSAALEFAVEGLGVKHIVVLGHARCGGIRATVDGAGESGFVSEWMGWLDRSVVEDCSPSPDDYDSYRAVEEAGIRQSIANLRGFSCVQRRLEEGNLTLHGAWFDIARGELWVMDGPTGEFHWTDGVAFK